MANAALLLFSAAAALQLVFTLLGWFRLEQPPLANSFQALNLWILLLSGVFLWVEWRWRLGLLGVFVSPLVSLTMFMGFRFIKLAPGTPPLPDASPAYLVTHVSLAMAGYALFTLAFGIGLAWLAQDRQLKLKRLGKLFYELPPLLKLESLLYRCIGAGIIALSLGLAGGAAWSARVFEKLDLPDIKITLNLAALALYGGVWIGRRTGLLAGRSGVWLSLAGWLVLFFGFYLVNTVGGGHGFRG